MMQCAPAPLPPGCRRRQPGGNQFPSPANLIDAKRTRGLTRDTLFRHQLPSRVKALSKWKSIDIQRINPDEPDYRRISSYLGKQTNLELIALDPFNSDLSPKKK